MTIACRWCKTCTSTSFEETVRDGRHVDGTKYTITDFKCNGCGSTDLPTFSPVYKYKCNRGHEWITDHLGTGLSLTHPIMIDADCTDPTMYCPHCLKTWVLANLGVVELVE